MVPLELVEEDLRLVEERVEVVLELLDVVDGVPDEGVVPVAEPGVLVLDELGQEAVEGPRDPRQALQVQLEGAQDAQVVGVPPRPERVPLDGDGLVECGRDLCGIPTDSRYLQLECSGTNF